MTENSLSDGVGSDEENENDDEQKAEIQNAVLLL